MKKRDLTTLAMIGISAGLALGGCQKNGKSHDNSNNHNNENGNGNAAEQTSQDMESFRSTLSPDAQKKFDELDAQHKTMAVEMANQECSGKNKCAGMGGCASAKNSCAGHNSCKGEGGPPVKNPDEAVDVQHNNQMNDS